MAKQKRNQKLKQLSINSVEYARLAACRDAISEKLERKVSWNSFFMMLLENDRKLRITINEVDRNE